METKLFKAFAAAAMSVLAIACAKEQVGGGVDTGVSFSVEVPGAPATKTIGDGLTAKTLYYQVFDSEGKTIEGLGVQNTTLSNKTATVKFQLMKDQTYKFVFWAQTDADGYYTIDGTAGLKKITANYTDKSANDENFDAFYAVEELTVTGPVTKSVTLKRPFAQFNIASSDKVKAGNVEKDVDLTGAFSTFTVKALPSVFAPIAGTFDGAADVEFVSAAVPTETLKVNGVNYKYLSMNYVFAPQDGTVYDIEAKFSIKDMAAVNFKMSTVPAKANWRTNIVGNVLTSDTDFDITVDPSFDGDETMSPFFVNGVGYKALDDAVSAVPTTGEETIIKFGMDISGNGIKTVDGQNVVIDLDGHTFNIDGETVGSAGSPTNGLQLLKGSKVVIKNGTIKSAKANILIQNYTDLTLENVVVDASESKVGYTGTYAISNNHGNVKIIGSTSIYARSGKYAFDVCYWASSTYADGVNVYVNTTGVIDGAIEYSCYIAGTEEDSKTKSSLVIDNAVLTHSSFKTTLPSPNIKVASGVFADDAAANAWVPNGYKSTKISDYYVVTKADITPVADQSGFDAALTQANSTVIVPAGTFSLPSSVAEGVTIEGVDGTVIDMENKVASGYKDVTFKNVTVKTGTEIYKGFQHATGVLTFDSCTFTGLHFGYGEKEVYKNCTFNQDAIEYHMWTYGANVDYIGCTFNGKGKFLNVYNEGGEKKTINIEDCTFNNTFMLGRKPAINVKGTAGKTVLAFDVNIKNCSVTGTFPAANGGLWQVDDPVSDMQQNQVKVTVDGKVVYPAE